MEFKLLCEKLEPRLRRLAREHDYHGSFINEDDLYQEMCLYLWSRYPDGLPPHINENYALKGCEFHIHNYIRTKRVKAHMVSIDQPLNEDGDVLGDILPAEQESLDDIANKDLAIDEIKKLARSNKKGKAVFMLMIEGRTARETGKLLGISHVMVLKHKKNLITRMKKVTRARRFLLK